MVGFGGCVRRACFVLEAYGFCAVFFAGLGVILVVSC